MKLEICTYVILKSNDHFIISGMSESYIKINVQKSHKTLQNIVAAFQSSHKQDDLK